tara:strand:- start:40684 stop:41115 length:432 start_codon:yes stop_codon:yes gene_type:complete
MAELLSFREGDSVSEAPVSLEEFLGASNATAVRIVPGEDARALLPHLDRIALVEVAFPAFGDGRGYSSAQILREAGYAGELRASGDVLVDQLFPMRRAGFDSFAPDAPLDPAVVEASLSRYADVYQKTVDGRRPIWAKRHEVA